MENKKTWSAGNLRCLKGILSSPSFLFISALRFDDREAFVKIGDGLRKLRDTMGIAVDLNQLCLQI